MDDLMLAEMQRLYETVAITNRAIAERLGVTVGVVEGKARRRGWVKFPFQVSGKPNPAGLPEDKIRQLWEETPLTAKQIAERFGLTVNTVIGRARRRGWLSFRPGFERGPAPKTLHDRLDAIHARMDAVLAECRDIPRLKVELNMRGIPRRG